MFEGYRILALHVHAHWQHIVSGRGTEPSSRLSGIPSSSQPDKRQQVVG